MKKLILSELLLLFLATTFMTDSPPPGWYQQTLPRGDVTVQDIFFLDSLTGHVVVRKNTIDSAFIFKTTNGGNNWATTYGADIYLTSIQFTDINTGYSVGSAAPLGIIKKSTNGGLNWFSVSAIGGYPIWDLSFVNNDTGWICSDDPLDGGIFKTTNGGINWQPQLGASYLIKKLFFINKDTGWVISNEATGKLYRTTNGGGAWNLQYTFAQQINDIYFFNSYKGNVSSGISYITTDGGFNWTLSNDGGIELTFVNDSVGWAGSNFSKIMKTTTGGITWFRQTSPIFDNSSANAVDSLKAWAGGTGLVHTTDGGPPSAISKISNKIPNNYRLYQNYPNPFNPKTNIKYQIPARSAGGVKNSDIILRVFDIQGREMTTLVNQKQNPGIYEVDFDGTNYSSGIYLYTLIADGKPIDTKKMVLIK